MPEIDAEITEVKHVGILHENLRERCLYEMIDEYDDESRHIFLNYLYDIKHSCLEIGTGNIHHNCAKRVMEKLGISYESVYNCIEFEKRLQRNDTKMGEFFRQDQ